MLQLFIIFSVKWMECATGWDKKKNCFLSSFSLLYLAHSPMLLLAQATGWEKSEVRGEKNSHEITNKKNKKRNQVWWPQFYELLTLFLLAPTRDGAQEHVVKVGRWVGGKKVGELRHNS